MGLHFAVVPHTRDLIGAIHPGKLPVDSIICANDVLVGDPVRAYDASSVRNNRQPLWTMSSVSKAM